MLSFGDVNFNIILILLPSKIHFASFIYVDEEDGIWLNSINKIAAASQMPSRYQTEGLISKHTTTHMRIFNGPIVDREKN